jgi:hypothetical protein
VAGKVRAQSRTVVMLGLGRRRNRRNGDRHEHRASEQE